MPIHDFVADEEEFLRRQRLREEVREVLIRVYIWNYEFAILDHLADVEMTTVDVFSTSMMLRVVR